MEKKRRQIEKLRAEERALKAQLRHAERKADTRRKIIAGSWLLAQTNGDFRTLAARMDDYLTRDQDRELFDLPPLPREGNDEHF